MSVLPSPDPGALTSRTRIARRLRALRREFRRGAREQRLRWRYRVERGHIEFDDEVHAFHHRLKQSVPAYLVGANPWSLLTAPIIYSLLVPLALIDLWASAYQALCFPIYGIARVRRSRYFALDRHTLKYLNAIEKANCTFCTYANGVLAYVREVAARTEQYWCPIKHAKPIPAPHGRYHRFLDYGDAAGYHRDLDAQRRELRPTVPTARAGG